MQQIKKQIISLLIKPASSLCNMRCKYCFYHDVAENREIKSYGIMSDETMEKLIFRAAEYAEPYSRIYIAFQGGEPTLAGLEYFRKFTETTGRYFSDGKNTISYSIQTNGLLIDDEWCGLLAENKFLVGLSMDCSSEIHDMHRIDAGGSGTYNRVIRAQKLMDKYKVDYNILSVITRAMARKPEKVFKEYLKNRYKYIQFIPCLKDLEDKTKNKFDLTPELYGDFLIETFRQWKHQLEVGNYISIRLFDNLVGLLKGYPAEQCGFLGKCGRQTVIEADGSVYPCDFYVLDEYNCGNIHENSFEEIDISYKVSEFMSDIEPLNSHCSSCKVFKLCGGGCKRYRRFWHSKENYCPYQNFLYEVYDELIEVAKKLS